MLKNLILTFFSKASVAVLNLLVLLVASQNLGSSIWGDASLLILNIAIAQIINEIYTGYALVHYIPGLSLKKLYSTGFLWTVICIGVVNLIFLIFNIGPKEFRLDVFLLSLAISLHSFHCVILLAREKFKSYGFLLFFQPFILLAVLCAGIFFFHEKSIRSYVISVYASYFSCLLISGYFVLRLLVSEKDNGAQVNSISILKNGLINQLGNLAHTLSNRYNFYLISSSVLVGIYSSATSLVESVWIIGGSIAPVILSHVANKKGSEANSRLTFLLSKASLILSLMCVAIIYLLPDDFFTWLLGKDFTGTKTLMLHLSPGVLCISFSTVISHYFSGSGNQRVQLIANSLGLLTTVCTSYFLVSRYQLIGACYAASLSYFVAALVLVIVFMKQNGFKFSSLFKIRKDLELLKIGTPHRTPHSDASA